MIVLVVAVVAVCVSVVVVAVGRGGQLAEFVRDHPPLGLPSQRPVAGTDIALLRLPTGPWGYDLRTTDEVMRRVAHVLTERDTRIAVLEQRCAELRTEVGRAETAASIDDRPGVAHRYDDSPRALEASSAPPDVADIEPGEQTVALVPALDADDDPQEDPIRDAAAESAEEPDEPDEPGESGGSAEPGEPGEPDGSEGHRDDERPGAFAAGVSTVASPANREWPQDRPWPEPVPVRGTLADDRDPESAGSAPDGAGRPRDDAPGDPVPDTRDPQDTSRADLDDEEWYFEDDAEPAPPVAEPDAGPAPESASVPDSGAEPGAGRDLEPVTVSGPEPVDEQSPVSPESSVPFPGDKLVASTRGGLAEDAAHDPDTEGER